MLVNGKPSKYSFSSGKLTLSGVSAAKGPFHVSISFDAVFNDPVDREPATFDNPGFGVAGSISDMGTFLLADAGWYPSCAGCSTGGTGYQIARLQNRRGRKAPVGPVAGLPGPPARPRIAARWRAATAGLRACRIAAREILEDFDLEVTAPRGIYAVTAGELIGHEDRGAISISSWKTGPIGQGLSLSAGRYIVRGSTARRLCKRAIRQAGPTGRSLFIRISLRKTIRFRTPTLMPPPHISNFMNACTGRTLSPSSP